MTRVRQRWASQAGFSLMEIMIVLGLMGVLTGIAVIQVEQARPGLKGDGGMRVVLSQLRQAREMAITQRRNMRVSFTLGNKVTITREEIPAVPPLTEIQTVLIEGGVLFNLVIPGDTPDGYGNSIEVSFPTATGSPLEVKFTPDGTLVNQDGVTLNGTVFLAIPTVKMSARAVTVLGSTGRIRGYRWDGSTWRLV